MLNSPASSQRWQVKKAVQSTESPARPGDEIGFVSHFLAVGFVGLGLFRILGGRKLGLFRIFGGTVGPGGWQAYQDWVRFAKWEHEARGGWMRLGLFRILSE